MKRNLKGLSTGLTNYINGSNFKTSISRVYVSVLSIILAILVGIIILLAKGEGALTGNFLSYITVIPFQEQAQHDEIAKLFIILVPVGIASAVAFKSGLFNIGMSGQMAMGGGLTFLLFLKYFSGDKVASLTFAPILAIVIGACFAGIAGFLKAMFNVHEVVSTILLNWIAVYVIKGVTFSTDQPEFGSTNPGQSAEFLEAKNWFVENPLLIAIVVSVVAVLIFGLMFRFTRLGFALKTSAGSRNAARIGGYSIKKNTILAMMISGAFAGFAGYGYYFIVYGHVPETSAPLLEGFDGIVISLVAFNSAIGILLTGMFFAVFRTGTSMASTVVIDEKISSLLTALMFYLIGISSLFLRFAPNIWTKYWIHRKLKTRTNDPYQKALESSKHKLNEYQNRLKEENATQLVSLTPKLLALLEEKKNLIATNTYEYENSKWREIKVLLTRQLKEIKTKTIDENEINSFKQHFVRVKSVTETLKKLDRQINRLEFYKNIYENHTNISKVRLQRKIERLSLLRIAWNERNRLEPLIKQTREKIKEVNTKYKQERQNSYNTYRKICEEFEKQIKSLKKNNRKVKTDQRLDNIGINNAVMQLNYQKNQELKLIPYAAVQLEYKILKQQLSDLQRSLANSYLITWR